MTISTRGIIRGSHIELETATGLPEGTPVSVDIKSAPMTREQMEQLASRLFGVFAEDTEFLKTMEEVERERSSQPPRDINLDAHP